MAKDNKKKDETVDESEKQSDSEAAMPAPKRERKPAPRGIKGKEAIQKAKARAQEYKGKAGKDEDYSFKPRKK